jgi:Adenine-specific methyltransferase EcoRI
MRPQAASARISPSLVSGTAIETTAGANTLLAAARKAKEDEYYTQWIDIEREMNAYLEYDPDAFRDKVVLLPCDDPEWSNFTKFFALHFSDFGLKKLISTSYAEDSKLLKSNYQPTIFETEAPQFDKQKTRSRGKLFVLERKDINGDGVINIEDLQWCYLDGDGDFRGHEVLALRDEADIIVTNPPFSLWRVFFAGLIESGKKFAIIGNQNALTYKEVFPLVQRNKLWLGKGFPRNMAHFRTPYTPHGQWIEQEGEDVVRVPSIQWFTNIDHGRRHEPMQLMTMADNIRFSKHKEVRGIGYQPYDNFDAIEVPFSDAIPGDYYGNMGVPVTFLAKYNPDQFEIVGITQSWDGHASRIYPKQTQVSARGVETAVTKLNDGAAIKVELPPEGKKTYYKVGDELFIKMYARIIIRRKDS